MDIHVCKRGCFQAINARYKNGIKNKRGHSLHGLLLRCETRLSLCTRLVNMLILKTPA
jgi:hypothetical protein